MLLEDIKLKQTRDAVIRCGLTETDMQSFDNIEQLQRHIYLEGKRRSNEKQKGYFKKYYQENMEKMKETSRIQKQKIKMNKIEESIVKKIIIVKKTEI